MLRLVRIIAITLVTAAPLAAQTIAGPAGSVAPVTGAPTSVLVPSVLAGPTVAAPGSVADAGIHAPFANAATVGVRPRTVQAAAPNAVVVKRAQTSHNMALMIVGGAALLVGAIIGGDAGTIVMVGGGVIGLYGLFRYLE